MDAFALARSKARSVREGVGTPFKSALDLVRQALSDKGFEISRAPLDGVLLRGDDAQLRRDFSQVLVRDDVGDDEVALLAAHELGHLVLHRPHDCCEIAASGVGSGSRALSRVETYGPRERRELQANVFAREFILPRQMARRLFVDEKLPASEIAKRIGMPLAEARRQIMESLLRPDDDFSGEALPSGPVKLDPSQQKAVDFDGPALLVEAGPGSGKTRTLVSRIERRLAQLAPSKILALTFSNKAAAELSTRIAERRADDAVEVWTGTFHAFGLEIMRLHYEKIGLSPKIRLLSPSQAVEMLEERLPLLGLRHFHDLRNPASRLKEILKPISRAKDELIGPSRFRELAEQGLTAAHARLAAAVDKKSRDAAGKAVIAAEKTIEAAQVYEVYERMLTDAKCVDFADLVMKAALLIESDEAVRQSCWDRYEEILVDEYQDVNRACARLLKALRGPKTTVWVVGDSRQSIYRFRGASSLNMGLFTQDFPGAAVTPLEWNYRSSDHIVGLCRTFAKAMDTRQAKGIDETDARLPYEAKAKRGILGTQTKLLVGLDDQCEADLVAAEIMDLKGQGVPLRHQTVLARTNARLDALAKQLGERGILTLHLGSFFEREEVRDLLSVLALVAEPNGAALVRIAAMREVDVHAADIATAFQYARERSIPLAKALADADVMPGLSTIGALSLGRLGKRLAGLTPHTPAFEVAAAWLLERSDYLREIAERPGIEGELSRAALWQIIEFCDQADIDGKPLDTREILRRVRTVILLSDDRDLREPGLGPEAEAVRLMTVHGAKGLEFPAVHVVGLHDKNFPLQFRTAICRNPPGIDDGRDPSEAHEEEEDCAMFVAISRAEDHLRLYHTQKAAKLPRSPSRFLGDLGIPVGATLSSSTFAAPSVGRMPEPIDVDTLTLHDVTDFESCPLKVAYRHRMSIRSRRHEVPFLQASGVIYEVLDRVGEIAALSKPIAEAIETAFDEVWSERGPVTHSLAEDYRALVRASLGRLAPLLAGFGNPPVKLAKVPIEGGHVLVPAPLLSTGSGPRTARFIELRTVEPRTIRAGLLHAAAVTAMGRRDAVEVAHLNEEDGVVTIARSQEEERADLAQVSELLRTIRSGALDARPEMRVCMRCAHFFSCPATGGSKAA